MKCKYCEEEVGHLNGCPETVENGLAFTIALREYYAGRFIAAAYCAREDGRSASYNLGFDLAEKQLALSPPNC